VAVTALAGGGSPFTKGAYALGKLVWGKGWEELLKLLDYCKETNSPCPATAIDCYGDGEARVSVHFSLLNNLNLIIELN
jgi:digalactosyldiacylglycerol synthase